MRVLGDFVIVEPDTPKESNVILLEDGAMNVRDLTGRIIAVGTGPNVKSAKVNDRVFIFGAIKALPIFGKKFLHLSFMDFIIFAGSVEEAKMKMDGEEASNIENARTAIVIPGGPSLN